VTAEPSWTLRPSPRGPARRWLRGTWRIVALATLGALLGALADSKVALAQTDAVVLYVEGPDAQGVRSVVLEALPRGITLADEKTFRAELVREGQSRPMGRDLDPGVIDRVRRAARVMGVAAVVVVRVRRDQAARRALVLVVPAWRTPASAEETTLPFTSRDDDVAAVTAALGESLEPYAPAPIVPTANPPIAPPSPLSHLREGPLCPGPPAPAAAAQRPPTTLEHPSPQVAERSMGQPRTPAQSAAASAVDLALAGEIVGRHFDYKNGIQPGGSRYTLFPAPAAGARGQLFPLARAGGPWGDIGVVAEYLRIFSEMNNTSSAAADVFPSSFSAGLRARIHPGSDPRLILGLSVEYSFISRRAVGPPPFELPDVTYRSIRPAIDTRVYFGRFSLLEEVAFHALFDQNAISTRFYAPRGYGIDAEFGAALALDRTIEARLAVDYEVYAFSFNPPAGATFEAGTARDQLVGAQLAVAFVL
jgi:hypothetical protein